jgi:hypothetical protein
MGNQASKAIEKSKERKSRQPTRARSHASSSISSSVRRKVDVTTSTENANPSVAAIAKHDKGFNNLVIDQDDYKEIDRSQRQVSIFLFQPCGTCIAH